jgi:hypothetical protein
MIYSEIFLIKKLSLFCFILIPYLSSFALCGSPSLCVLCGLFHMWFNTLYVFSCTLCGSSPLMCSYVPYVVHLLIWLNTPYVFLCALCGSNLPTITPSSKQRPHHFINFSTLNQFNFKILLINSLVVFRNDDFIKAQFFRFINTLLNTIHRSHLSR